MEHNTPMSTTSMVSSSNLSSTMVSPDPEASAAEWSKAERISFKGPSPPDTSQHSARIKQFVPKPITNSIQPKNSENPAQCQEEHVQKTRQNPENSCDSGLLRQKHPPANQSQWINHILDQKAAANLANAPSTNGRECLTTMRSVWEQRISEGNVQKEHEEIVNAALYARRQFLFPKWRSVDPLTASLVASHKTPEMIPRDSRIPQHRQQMLMETERNAPQDKLELHKPYIELAVDRHLRKAARRLFVPARPQNADELARAHAVQVLQCAQKQQWYDLAEIRQQISHESIANVGATRQMFERGDVWEEGGIRRCGSVEHEKRFSELVPNGRNGNEVRRGDEEVRQAQKPNDRVIYRSVHKF